MLGAIEANGPFDGIHGVSQGGLVAGPVNDLPLDEALAAAPDAICVLLRTSGGTSLPKLAPQRQRDVSWRASPWPGSCRPPIESRTAFFRARIPAMYPLYAPAVLLALVNLIPSGQPGTFPSVLHWNALPGDATRFTATLETGFATAKQKLTLSVSDVMAAGSIREVAMIVDAARCKPDEAAHPVLQAA